MLCAIVSECCNSSFLQCDIRNHLLVDMETYSKYKQMIRYVKIFMGNIHHTSSSEPRLCRTTRVEVYYLSIILGHSLTLSPSHLLKCFVCVFSPFLTFFGLALPLRLILLFFNFTA